jgi:subtilisin-like proprotein convertase family protein
MKTKLRLVLSIPLLFACLSLSAQQTGIYWENSVQVQARPTLSGRVLKPRSAQAFVLSETPFRRQLEALPPGGMGEVVLSFPDASGRLQNYRVRENPVMAPELQRRYPGIRSFIGYGMEGNPARVRFSFSHKGLQATVTDPSENQTLYLEKDPDRPGTYLLFARSALQPTEQGWKCKTPSETGKDLPPATAAQLVDDQQLRRYRVAIAASGEYTQYHGGTVADALAAINATLTRVNEVFERDLAIALELVPDNDRVIFTDPETDPFESSPNSEVQQALDSLIGAPEYDLGHLFDQGGDSGNAGFIGSVCVDGRKGSAFARNVTPEGDRFDLDFVAHEMGHQLGANHTWSFQSEGTGVQAEPGSGSTIMGYAGITQNDDVQSVGDDYFHYYSILQISQYVSGTSCAALTPLANTPPVITPVPDFVIPRGTAFVLEGAATDANPTDVLTYAWEQIDDGVVTRDSFGPENPAGANFRSRRPVTEPRRFFPLLSRVASGNLTQTDPLPGTAWETVATIGRELNFALTVRDNAPGGGQVTSEVSTVTVREDAGPFRVLSQSQAETFEMGSVQEVSWDVAGTGGAPINAQLVDLYLSADGGLSFPLKIASNLPNTGSARVQIPRVPTPSGRFVVRAADNIFFALNSTDFEIAERPFLLYFDALQAQACQPSDAVFDFTYQTFGGFEEPVALGVTGLPEGLQATFSVDTVQVDDTRLRLTLSNTDSVPAGTYPFEVIGIDGVTTVSVPLEVRLGSGAFRPATLLSPADAAEEVGLFPLLEWEGATEYTAYDLELATEPTFASPIASQRVYTTSYAPGRLQENTVYFWRIRPLNACGEGVFGTPFSFSTLQSDCKTLTASGLPVPIPATGTPTVTASLTIPDNRPLLGVKVNLELTHSYLADLVISLTSPQGTRVTLVSNACGEANDINATFDSEAPPFVCANNPAISGTVRPSGSLNSFVGESSFGEWVLTIEDGADNDGGQLLGFSLELCVEGAFRPDEDGDGVFDDGDDLCPGTPPGAEVDANGCEVLRFPSDRFEILVSTESCIGAGDGSIAVTASQSFDYSIAVTGNGTNLSEGFTATYDVEGLRPGSYEVCLGGSDGANAYEPQCFQVVIGSPDPLSVQAFAAPDYSSVELLLDGAELFEVTLNGNSRTVKGPVFTLELEKGFNQLRVEGIPACRGSYEAEFLRADQPLLSPNPFTEALELIVPRPDGPVDIAVFNAAGALVWKGRRLPDSDARVRLELGALPTGLYLLRVTQKGRETTYKVYRE